MLLQGFIQSGLENFQGWRMQSFSSSTAGMSSWWKCFLHEVWMCLISTYCLSSSQHTRLWVPCPFQWPPVGPSRQLSGLLKPSVPSAEQAQLPQPLLIRQLLQVWLSWWPSTELAAGCQCFNCTGGPKLDAVLYTGSNIVQRKEG